MATKSFYTEFKLNTKAGNKLANAVDHSRRVNVDVKQPVKIVKDKSELNNIMDEFFFKTKGQ
ncbi:MULTISPECIES: hypothetical protein [Listeria]|uniref:hypothetical protein n=1 Tax=Listeria TaxID=1637 RepID=UPI000B5973ED|nr:MULTISPECIES: hypothetical protein [Listeria]